MLRYVQSFVDRHGHARHYFRKAGKRVALPGLPGSDEFMAAYAAALAEQEPPKNRPVRRAVAPRSIQDLIARYYGSPHYLSLKPVTRGNYRRILDGFCTAQGHRPVAGFRREHVTMLMGKMADRPGAAIVLLKRLKTVMRFALELGWIDIDPTHRARSYSSREFHTWTDEEITQFEARWPIGTKQRLAFALHLYTGQRRSDVHRMTWGHIRDEAIRVVQQKTGAELAVALHPDLASILASTKRSAVTILVTEYGKPFTVAGYGQWMADAIGKAGLPDCCVLHGLRKAAARRLAEAGCSGPEIMAITGHKSLQEVDRYIRAASQAKLSKQAVERQSRNASVSNRGAPIVNPRGKAK